MNIFDKFFRKKKQKVQQDLKKLPSIEEFPKLNSDEKMGIVMILGDSGKLEFFPYLKYAIEQETDIDVKFAALKRIHLFRNHPNTIPMITELMNNGLGEEFEPYFSMALSRLGIISIEEFEEKINNQK